jgi:hypothetical protein
MPNGGSDCCGTCWFNAKNRGEEGYAHANSPEQSRCSIRNVLIDNPFYTYCGNHPYRRPDKDPIPIGPVFTGDSSGARTPWKDSPDSEEVRDHLLELLKRFEQEIRPEYPIGAATAEIVVWQLGEFREKRAAETLRGMISSNTLDKTPGSLTELAREALKKIEKKPN